MPKVEMKAWIYLTCSADHHRPPQTTTDHHRPRGTRCSQPSPLLVPSLYLAEANGVNLTDASLQ